LTSYRYNSSITATDRSFNHDELTLCKERIEKFCKTSNEVDKWLVDLENKEWEASASLLMSCMPNVERIQINEYKESSSNSFDRVLEHAAMLQSQGSNSPLALSRLRFVHGSFNTWTSLERLMPFLRLKSLKTAEFDPTFDDIGFRDEMPNLEMETLVLGIVVDGEWSRLEEFLGNFKKLKCFRLREDDFERDPYYESDPHTLDEAISGLKHCLEELEIDQLLRAPEEPPWISSLADFQKLCKISLSAYVLFKPHHKPRRRNIDVLPASLEALELISYDQYAVDQLLEILQRRQESVPKLVHIQLKRRVVDYRDKTRLARFEEAVGDLKKKCNDAAIALQFFEERTVQAVDNRSTMWSQIE
jgi:hypothetical protein